jgi:hypothetical protein
MATLEEKKKELEALLKELELSENVALQKKVKTYRKEFPLISDDETSKKDYKLLIEKLKLTEYNVSVLKSKQLINDTLTNLKNTISKLKNEVNLALKDTDAKEAQAKIELIWANIGVSVAGLADTLMSGQGNEIEALLKVENEESQKEAKERFDKLEKVHGYIKEVYKLIEESKALKEDDFIALRKKVKPESNREDLKESKEVKLDFKILHYKKNINFKKKEDLIAKIVKVNGDFTELVDDIGDVKRYEAALNAKAVTLTSKMEEDLDKLEVLLDKEDEKGDDYSIPLVVVFKKVKEDGQTGWIIDPKGTKAPGPSEERTGEAVLSYKPKVEFEHKVNKNSFVSKVIYTIPITRAPFKYKKFNVLKFGASLFAAIGAAVIALGETKKDELGPLLVSSGTILGGVATSIEEGKEEKKTETVTCTITLEYNTTDKGAAKVTAITTGNLDRIGLIKKHSYESNMQKAIDLFIKNAEEKL